MKTALIFANPAGIETELLAVLAVDSQTAKGTEVKPQPSLLTADEAVRAAAETVLASGEFKAGATETLLLHAPAGLKAKRLLLVGLGKQGKATVNSVRSAAGTAVRFTKPRGIRELVLALPDGEFLPPGPCSRAYRRAVRQPGLPRPPPTRRAFFHPGPPGSAASQAEARYRPPSV